MERTSRKVYRGTVISDKMDKTIVVEVSTSKRHPLYGKRVKYSKSFKAHDELNWYPPFTLRQGLQATADWYRLERRN